MLSSVLNFRLLNKLKLSMYRKKQSYTKAWTKNLRKSLRNLVSARLLIQR